MRTARFVLAVAAAVAFGAPAEASAANPLFRIIRNSEGAWLYGCIENDLAAHLVAQAGFSYGADGSPALILCIDGYQFIGKRLK